MNSVYQTSSRLKVVIFPLYHLEVLDIIPITLGHRLHTIKERFVLTHNFRDYVQVSWLQCRNNRAEGYGEANPFTSLQSRGTTAEELQRGKSQRSNIVPMTHPDTGTCTLLVC